MSGGGIPGRNYKETHECYFPDLEPEAGEFLEKVTCKKHPSHKEFIPINKFSKSDLDKYFPTDLDKSASSELSRLSESDLDSVFNYIKAIAGLTVRIRCNYVSTERPDHLLLNRTMRRGRKVRWHGTGYVSDEPRRIDNCQYPKYDDGSTNTSYIVRVNTAAHVVFDSSEAAEIEVEFFADDPNDESSIVKWSGLKVVDREETKDWCVLLCVTHEKKDFDKVHRTFKEVCEMKSPGGFFVHLRMKKLNEMIKPVHSDKMVELPDGKNMPETRDVDETTTIKECDSTSKTESLETFAVDRNEMKISPLPSFKDAWDMDSDECVNGVVSLLSSTLQTASIPTKHKGYFGKVLDQYRDFTSEIKNKIPHLSSDAPELYDKPFREFIGNALEVPISDQEKNAMHYEQGFHFIISHPHGKFKHITMGNEYQMIHEDDESFMRYKTPTCPGSSGAQITTGLYLEASRSHCGSDATVNDYNRSGSVVTYISYITGAQSQRQITHEPRPQNSKPEEDDDKKTAMEDLAALYSDKIKSSDVLRQSLTENKDNPMAGLLDLLPGLSRILLDAGHDREKVKDLMGQQLDLISLLPEVFKDIDVDSSHTKEQKDERETNVVEGACGSVIREEAVEKRGNVKDKKEVDIDLD